MVFLAKTSTFKYKLFCSPSFCQEVHKNDYFHAKITLANGKWIVHWVYITTELVCGIWDAGQHLDSTQAPERL